MSPYFNSCSRPTLPRTASGEVLNVVRNPWLRWTDVPGSMVLAETLALHPDDHALKDMFAQVAQDRAALAIAANDPFWGNYPILGALPPFAPGRIPIARLSTGESLSIAFQDATRNVLLCGPTGGGKTNWLRLLLLAVLAQGAQP